MDARSTAPSKRNYSDRIVFQYISAYFDHLHSEYLRIAPTVEAEKTREIEERLAVILERRKKEELTWDDVYSFDLEILELLSDEDLVRKAYDMRAKYRSIAGARDYDAYIASKPPDLTTLQIESTKKPEDKVSVATEVLRADIRYLLGQFYLHYSLMPLREGLRDELTRRARKWTLIFLFVFSVLLISSQLIELVYQPAKGLVNSTVAIVTSTVGVVIFSGIMGGCVSMLQRIQSAPNEGDALYNLAALSHGWKGISLSPLYGAIFAMLLYILFTAGILKGAVFPEVETLRLPATATSSSSSSQSQESSATNSSDSSASTTDNPHALSGTTMSVAAPKRLPFSDTAPVDGKAYALLVIWSFIAGFAERLVPDTLNRLVTKNQAIQGTNG
ncbi:MAG: hypothetical protein ICV60_03450 [Pyrinomonadaceae bacterium]|nr:hypothetical protein [Pyrinomonadaceae bacterium]